MFIVALLSAVMLVTACTGFLIRRRAPAIGWTMVPVSLAGLYFVWMPAHLTQVANALGVGRGTDLVLYLWVSIGFLALAGLVFQLRHLQRQITLLARDLALERARRPSCDAPGERPSGPRHDGTTPAPDPVASTAREPA